jgi:uncharacterized protein with HEPN domain
MSRSPLDYCRHILDETAFLIEQSGKLDEASFAKDPVAQRAFVRSFEIIGEASKQLDPDLRGKYSDIPWTKMARMRDKVIHHYFGVEYDLVWLVVQEEIPKLDASLRDLLEREE